MNAETLTRLSDSDLLLRTQEAVSHERGATASLVAHLIEIERRNLHLSEGCSSLFSYCTRILHLSEHAAYNRIEAARAARRFPAILAALECGDVHLTAVRLLAPSMTAENHLELLAAARHKSRHEVEELLARLRPQPAVAATVRRLPVSQVSKTLALDLPAGATETTAATIEASTDVPAARGPQISEMPNAPERPRTPQGSRATVEPLAPERYRVQFTANRQTRDKLRRAQELLRHRIPDGDVGRVIDLALDLLVKDLEKKKFAATPRPRHVASTAQSGRGADPLAHRGPGGGASPGRYIPAGVKRLVWERDQGRCTYIGTGGMRCTERTWLEFDHIRPHADGGRATVDNVRLLCRAHNLHEARQFFGAWQAEPAGAIQPWG